MSVFIIVHQNIPLRKGGDVFMATKKAPAKKAKKTTKKK